MSSKQSADVSDDEKDADKSRDGVKSLITECEDITINVAKIKSIQNSNSTTLIHTAVAVVNDQDIKIMLDPGADASVTTKRCLERLGLTPTPTNRTLNISTMAGKTSTSSKTVELKFSDEIRLRTFALESNITLDPQKVDLKQLWPTLDKNLAKEVKKNITSGQIDVIIGVDQLYGKVSNTKIIPHPKRRLALMHTIFGYSLGGSTEEIGCTSRKEDAIQLMTSTFETKYNSEPTNQESAEREIQENMMKMFEQEVITTPSDAKEKAKTEDEKYADDQFKKSIVFKDGRYWVTPLFKKKEDYKPMFNNYNIVEKSYRALRRKLSKNPKLEEGYKAEIQKLIADGHVEAVNESPLYASEPKRLVNYLPQLVVEKPDRITTKIRPVFNASSKNNENVSLNDNILSGRKTQKSISHLSIRMRLNPHVILADLQKMFYNINYIEEPDGQPGLENNRDLFRILWNNDAEAHPKVYRFVKVLMGCSSSPYLANSVVEHHLERIIENSNDENEVDAAKLLTKSMYIDDVIAAVDSVNKAITMAATISKIFNDMGMKVTKFASNTPEVLATIPKEDLAPTIEKEFPRTPISQATKVIGMSYIPEKDLFTFEPYGKLLERKVVLTKRGISSIIPTIYDVNGHIEPYILKAKMILSKAWTYEKDSDEKDNTSEKSRPSSLSTHNEKELLLAKTNASTKEPKSPIEAIESPKESNESNRPKHTIVEEKDATKSKNPGKNPLRTKNFDAETKKLVEKSKDSGTGNDPDGGKPEKISIDDLGPTSRVGKNQPTLKAIDLSSDGTVPNTSTFEEKTVRPDISGGPGGTPDEIPPLVSDSEAESEPESDSEDDWEDDEGEITKIPSNLPASETKSAKKDDTKIKNSPSTLPSLESNTDGKLKNNTEKKTSQKPKRIKLGWDDPLPEDLAKDFLGWLDELKVVSKYSFKRYIFGQKEGKFLPPPPKDTIELHGFVDGGGAGYGIVIFLRFKDDDGFKMTRIFSCSRIVSPKSSLSVPRRELSAILLGVKKAIELATEFDLSIKNVFVHTDSTICLYWLKKSPGDLNTYVSNRVKEIQKAGIKIFYTSTSTNPADNVSKLKPVTQYLEDKLWEEGPDYMKKADWYVGRSIEEIKEEKSPTKSEEDEIFKEVRKKKDLAHINWTQITITQTKENIISRAQLKTNNLLKIKRMLVVCFKFLIKSMAKKIVEQNFPFGGGESATTDSNEGSTSSNTSATTDSNEGSTSPNATADTTQKVFWAPFQRKFYAATKAKIDEIPSKLKSKMKENFTVVKFLVDCTYSMIPTEKLEPFGNKELDEKRSKRDPIGHKAAITLSQTSSSNPEKDFEIETNSNINISTNKASKETITPSKVTSTSSIVTYIASRFKSLSPTYDADELDAILKVMVINDQRITFAEEYDQLERGENIDKKSDITSLSPFLSSDGTIRMRTRLEYCDVLPEQTKYPIILSHPKKSRLAELLIIEAHENLNHAGPESTKRQIRNSHWIVGGKRAITMVLGKCQHKKCVGQRLKPIIQNPPPLPPERSIASCFDYISLDGIGPFELLKCGTCHYNSLCEKCHKKKSESEKDEDKKKRNCKTRKCWITMFTCVVTRCVSLELVLDKTCESFLMSFQRHCSENAQPKWVLSDNDPAYIQANDELQNVFRSDLAKRYYADHGIKWRFTPKRSPQHNGISESLVKVVRQSLRGVFGSQTMTEQEFTTALKLAQMKINSRPLIGLSDDPSDENILTITPFHLKLAKPVAILPSSIDQLDATDLDKIKLSIKDRWQKRKVLQHKFFVKWKEQYLMSIAKNQNNENKEIHVGDVILLLNERKTKETWPLARVTKVFKSADGIVRSIECKRPIKVDTKKHPTKQSRNKNAKNSDNKGLSFHVNERITTRGVEQIAILESVDSQPQKEKDVENTIGDLDVGEIDPLYHE